MTRVHSLTLFAPVLAAAAGCGDGSGPGAAVVSCEDVAPTALSPGQVAVTDASETACLRLAEAGAAGAEYLYVAYSAAGDETREGTAEPYLLSGSNGGPPLASTGPPARDARWPGEARGSENFHARLRALGRDLAQSRFRPGGRARLNSATLAAPPVIGERRTFNVLRSADVTGTDPDDYVSVEGTARYVGSHTAIFLDAAAPADGGYTAEDLVAIGGLFDDHLHPIGVTAFGAETDVNGDGVVLVLLTSRVTRLAGCDEGQVVVGLFFAGDLFEDFPGSNNAEIFYGLTPDQQCGVSRERAVELLPSVFIHEFQHMINYGQHVIARGGDAEDTWLDEGLSGFAEELGGRLVPDDRCLGNDCLTQFHRGNFVNAYRYLLQPGDAYLIGPRRPPLPLTQYGATWLFVRWLADHFAAEQPHGADLTRSLVQTGASGAENVASVTGVAFDRLVGEWQIANHLEDHPDHAALAEGTRYRYTSWNLRQIFASFHEQDAVDFVRPYPLVPDDFGDEPYSRTGDLRAGSGQHVLVRQAAGAIRDLRLTAAGGESPLPADLYPRTAVLRLR